MTPSQLELQSCRVIYLFGALQAGQYQCMEFYCDLRLMCGARTHDRRARHDWVIDC